MNTLGRGKLTADRFRDGAVRVCEDGFRLHFFESPASALSWIDAEVKDAGKKHARANLTNDSEEAAALQRYAFDLGVIANVIEGMAANDRRLAR